MIPNIDKQKPYQQHGLGWMVYPASGWRKWIFKMPIIFWRLGLSRLIPYNFLLLTTVGRKSGLPRRTMLEYSVMDGHIYLISGWGEHAQWLKNLHANPNVVVQTAHEGTIAGRAIRVTDESEIARLFEKARGNSAIWESYLASWGVEDNLGDFLAKKDRLVILRIDPLDSPVPVPLQADLVWAWPMIGGLVVSILWFYRSRKSFH